jgi:putative FmdB family regulatory protein
MPIYAYRCELCDHQQDFLQKMSDPHLTQCPACNQPGLKRQLTAAGFQLKGSGWYVTDFKNNNASNSKKPSASERGAGAKAGESNVTPSTSTASATESAGPSTAASPAPTAATTTTTTPKTA